MKFGRHAQPGRGSCVSAAGRAACAPVRGYSLASWRFLHPAYDALGRETVYGGPAFAGGGLAHSPHVAVAGFLSASASNGGKAWRPRGAGPVDPHGSAGPLFDCLKPTAAQMRQPEFDDCGTPSGRRDNGRRGYPQPFRRSVGQSINQPCHDGAERFQADVVAHALPPRIVAVPECPARVARFGSLTPLARGLCSSKPNIGKCHGRKVPVGVSINVGG